MSAWRGGHGCLDRACCTTSLCGGIVGSGRSLGLPPLSTGRPGTAAPVRWGSTPIASCRITSTSSWRRGPPPLARFMQGVQETSTHYFNPTHHKVGHVFQGPYKAIVCANEPYLSALIRYIQLNPVRAGLVRRPLEKVLTAVADHLRGAPAVLKGPDRGWRIARRRTLTAYTLVRRAGFPVTHVAAAWGRDITTVSASLSRLAAALEKNRGLAREVQRLEKIV